MTIIKQILRYILSFPTDIFGWHLTLIIHMLWGAKLEWVDGVLRTTLNATSWPMRTWYKSWGGTTFGHSMMLAPDMDSAVFQHELVHVEQIESNALYGAVLFVLLSAIGWWWLGLIVWAATPPLAYLSATLVSWLRSEPNAYRGNVYETAAYAIAGAGCSTAAPDTMTTAEKTAAASMPTV